MPSSPTPTTETYGTRSSRQTSLAIPEFLRAPQGTTSTQPPGFSLPPVSNNWKSAEQIKEEQRPRFNNNGLPLVYQYDETTNSLYNDAPTSKEFGGSRGFYIFEADDSSKYIKFKVTPEVSETGSVNYVEEGDIRAAASILIYMGSPSRTFSVSAKLVSRTTDEAAQNFQYLKQIRSWRMPKKEKSTGANGRAIESGAGTPQILILKDGKMLNDIQVVMRSLSIEFSNESDRNAVADGDITRMPIILPINMSFQEIHSFRDINQFDLATYKVDGLQYW